MQFRTLLNKYESQEIIDYQSKILLIGSCFAQHLHQYLALRKYDTYLNPCGITFNPISIANSIYYTLGLTAFNPNDIREQNGRFFHFDFHGKFSDISKSNIENKITDHLALAKAYANSDVLVISLGTSFVYELVELSEVVNNCHKVEQSKFKKVLLSTDAIVEVLSQAISNLRDKNSDIKVIFTVSPVRHIKDGLVENNRSKARLIQACELLEAHLENIQYFPSYEILLDDLRDYRFYRDDMIHPNESAVSYIMKQFEKNYMNGEEAGLRSKILNIQKRIAHKPFLPESAEHQNFLNKLMADINSLGPEMFARFGAELEAIQKQIIKI